MCDSVIQIARTRFPHRNSVEISILHGDDAGMETQMAIREQRKRIAQPRSTNPRVIVLRLA